MSTDADRFREEAIAEEQLEAWKKAAFRYLDARYPELPWTDAGPEPVQHNGQREEGRQ